VNGASERRLWLLVNCGQPSNAGAPG